MYHVDNQAMIDWLFKLQPIIELLIQKFTELYAPSKYLSLDEMTIAFKGMLKQYNPKKLDKWGYKSFVLSKASTGYTLDWKMFTGRDDNANGADADIGAKNKGVRNFMRPFTGKGHELYMDSYYTNPDVVTELAEGWNLAYVVP